MILVNTKYLVIFDEINGLQVVYLPELKCIEMELDDAHDKTIDDIKSQVEDMVNHIQSMNHADRV